MRSSESASEPARKEAIRPARAMQPARKAATRIVIAGAGTIGCFIGGLLQHAGRDVTFLGRPRMTAQLRENGLRLTDSFGLDARLAAAELAVREDPECLSGADIILVTVKSGATGEIAQAIKAQIPDQAPDRRAVMSLQNGVSNIGVLRETLGGMRVIAGMVPFNVVNEAGGHFHRGTSGAIFCDADHADIIKNLETPHLDICEHTDMTGVLWGKLLINLNNALVALSDLTLRQELLDRRWRRVIAAQQREGLRALSRAGLEPQAVLKVSPRLMPFVMSLPNFLYRLVAGGTLRIDPAARSSMWQDLVARRTTEIEALQGQILHLAATHGLDAPVNQRVYELIKKAEAAATGPPGLRPGDIM